MMAGLSTREGTQRFAARHAPLQAHGFFRPAQRRAVASLGLGTYLGAMDEDTDRRYTESVMAAVRGGINLLDTSLNYRHQRSERNVGAALRSLIEVKKECRREEIMVCTKAGYLVPDAIPRDQLTAADIVGNMHSLAPAFLEDQLERSRANLGLATIDVFYLHNPETQLGFVAPEEFYARCRRAFELLERAVSDHRIRFYGLATWEGLRQREGGISLVRCEQIAREVAGDRHNLRFIQLPVNLAMPEAYTYRREAWPNGEMITVLEAAQRLGITVIGSASLMQARLAKGLPDKLAELFPGATSDALRAIQFARSTPGLTSALVGMSRAEHVESNLAVARLRPIAPEQYAALFRS